MAKPAYYRGIRADLDAANREVSDVMRQNAALREERDEAYQQGYKDAMGVAGQIAQVNQAQAQLISYYIGIVTGGPKK